MADVVIDLFGQSVRVFSTHLDYRSDPSVRRTQVNEILRYIDAAEMPVILVGDLNAPPDAPELQPLFEKLTDAWRAGHGDGLSYPSDRPVKRIDYVLMRGPWSIRNAQVGTSTVSDHRPVVADLVFRKKPGR